LQEYIEGAENGDVRVLMLNGEPIGAMKRVPAKGEIRSNVHAGGDVRKHNLTKQEKELCKFIGPKLIQDGLYFVGVDIINGKLIEVNVQSPGGISRINSLNKAKLQTKIIDFIENVIQTRKVLIERKNILTKVIDDANIV
jgi:glutathione synthase